MNIAIVAVIVYFVYCYSMGAAAVLAYRYTSSPWRYVPGILTVIYYALAWLYPHRVIKEALKGTPSPGDDWRFIISCIVFSLCMYLLNDALCRREAKARKEDV